MWEALQQKEIPNTGCIGAVLFCRGEKKGPPRGRGKERENEMKEPQGEDDLRL